MHSASAEDRSLYASKCVLIKKITIAHHSMFALPSVVFKNDQTKNDGRCDYWARYVIRSFVLYARSIPWLRVSVEWRATLSQVQGWDLAGIRHHRHRMNS